MIVEMVSICNFDVYLFGVMGICMYVYVHTYVYIWLCIYLGWVMYVYVCVGWCIAYMYMYVCSLCINLE